MGPLIKNLKKSNNLVGDISQTEPVNQSESKSETKSDITKEESPVKAYPTQNPV
jgi:hypothetical protein